MIGLGPVGLSMLAASLNNGHEVIGIDLDEQVINRHVRKMKGKELDINKREYQVLCDNQGRLILTCEYDREQLSKVSAFFICVSTDAVLPATQYLRDYLSRGATVFIESTIYPLMIPNIIEGLGEGCKIVFSSERVMEGRLLENLYSYKKVVGVRTKEEWYVAKVYYAGIGIPEDLLFRCSPEEATLSKIVENSYRHDTIVFGHMVADVCREIPNCDYSVVRDAVNTKSDITLPYSGLGIGGPCLVENVEYLIIQAGAVQSTSNELEARLEFETCRTRWDIPNLVKEKIGIDKKKSVVVMGAAYRPNGQSTLNSPSLKLVKNLRRTYENVFVYDSEVEQDASILREGLYEFVDNYNIDVVVLSLNSDKLLIEFEGLMHDRSHLQFLNLTQCKFFPPNEIDYSWMPC